MLSRLTSSRSSSINICKKGFFKVHLSFERYAMGSKGEIVMAYQAVFKRYELKYKVTAEQKAKIIRAMEPYMVPNEFGRSTVRNIYYDTDDCVLARHSIAKPDFKEKLRVRSYSKADAESTVFVELKRKYDHVVYKRRVALSEKDAMEWIARGWRSGDETQLGKEIDYFLSYYEGLKPALYLSYDREAYKMRDGMSRADGGSDFRVTFDSNIRCRETELSLEADPYGKKILEDGIYLMELKCSGGIPLWLTKVLSEEHIYKTSFSKYGTAYCNFMEISPIDRSRMIAAGGLSAGTRSFEMPRPVFANPGMLFT